MSIYIKGMEMPKPGQEISIAENWDGAIYARLEPLGDWCPLVELPEHGRLGDLDALESNLRHMARFQHGERQQGILGCCDTICSAHTIIPASDEEGL